MNSRSTALVRLGDAGLTVPFEQDVRVPQVVDRDGASLGEVADLYVDEAHQRVRFLEISSGGFLGFGADRRLLPVDAVTRVAGKVHVSTMRTVVAGSPTYDPDVTPATSTDQLGALYGYYGIVPYWAPGYVPPPGYW